MHDSERDVAEEAYQKLKENNGTVTIKVEEVLLPIFARGLLNYREQRIVWAVISDSWRWRNQQFTQRPVNLSHVARVAGLSKGDVSKIWRDLVCRGVLILASARSDRKQRASFNEHYESWGLVNYQRWQNTNPGLVNYQPKVSKIPTRTGCIAIDDNSLQDPKNNIKSNIKNKRGAQKTRTSISGFQEFKQWWEKTWSGYNNGDPYHWNGTNGKRLQQLLNTFSLDELKARATFAFENAGQPGPLGWFEPPLTFPQFASENIINRCLGQTEGSAGYTDADTLLEQEKTNETT